MLIVLGETTKDFPDLFFFLNPINFLFLIFVIFLIDQNIDQN